MMQIKFTTICRYVFLLAISLFLNNVCWAQKFDFQSSELPRFRNGKSILCVNNTLIAVGGWQKNDSLTGIYRSTDSGKSWNIINDGFGGMLQHISSPTSSSLFAVGRSGTFAKSTDAGISWKVKQINNYSTTEFTCAKFLTPQLGFLSGWNEYSKKGIVLKTNNGGDAWTVLCDTLSQKINAIQAVDSLNIIIAGNNGSLYFTSNCGKSWNTSSLPANIKGNNLFAIEILPNSEILVAGGKTLPDSNQVIIRSKNLGASFETLINQQNYCINNIKFAAGMLYGVGQKGLFFLSKDTGKSLQYIAIPDNNTDGRDLYGLSLFNPGLGAISGLYGRTMVFKNLDYQLPKLEFIDVKISKKNQVKYSYMVEPRGYKSMLFIHIGTSPNTFLKKKIDAFEGFSTFHQSFLDTLSSGYYFVKLELVYNGTSIFSNVKNINLNFNTSLNFDFESWDSTQIETLQHWNSVGSVTRLKNQLPSIKIKAQTTSEPGAIFIANINNNILSGGTPFIGKPDTLFVKSGYQINKKDSAHIQLWFKNKGQISHTLQCKWTGSSNDTILAFPVYFPQQFIPDSLMIVCLSTNYFGGTIDTSSTLFLDSIWFSGTNSGIPNSGFHNWVVQKTFEPIFWHANNPSSHPQKNIIPTQGVFPKSKALQMFADPESAKNTQLLLGNSSSQFQMKPTMQVNKNYTSLKGYYQFSRRSAADTFMIEVFAFKDTGIVGFAKKIITDSVLNWLAFDLPIIYNDTTQANGMNIVFSLKSNTQNTQNLAQNYFKLDELSFENLVDSAFTAKTKHLNLEDQISIYPNPNDGNFSIENNSSNPVIQITIYSSIGKPVWIANNLESLKNKTRYPLQLQDLPSGIYIVCVQTNLQKTTKTIVVQH